MAERQAVAAMANDLICQHLDTSWSFAYDRAKRRSGACHFDRHAITLSQPITDVVSLDDMRQVMFHEIAHALVGPTHAHDRLWRRTAERLGYDGRRLSSEAVDAKYAPYIGTCPRGHIIYRYRLPKHPCSCSRCFPGYNAKFRIVFARRVT